MCWLVRDFTERGYYEERERTVNLFENGKICWQQTIKRSRILHDGGNIVFRDLYRFKNILDSGSLLSEIYKCALHFSVGQVGFLYGVSHTAPSKFKADDTDISFMLYVLGKALGSTYNDYKRSLIEHLITVLGGVRGASSAISLSVKDREFEYVFEYLVNSVFGTENVRDYYNHSSYVIDGVETAASKMRPDTVMKNPVIGSPDYYILDAKYYNYGYTKQLHDLPQSSSITKQISYNHYLEDRYADKAFYSVFVLPFAKEENDDVIKYVGVAKNEARMPVKNENKIAVCLVDLKTLVNAHCGVGESKEELREKLSRIVSDNCFK